MTHAVQSAVHQRFAVNYLNPAEMVELFRKLEERAQEARCELLVQSIPTFFKLRPPCYMTDKMGISSFTSP